MRNLRGSLQAGDLFACQAVDDLISPPLPLWLYQTNQGKSIFPLNISRREAPPPSAEQLREWNDNSCINYVHPHTEGSEWTGVDRQPVTLRRRWWKNRLGHSESQRVRGQRLSPSTKMLPLCSSVTGQTPWVMFARTWHSCARMKRSSPWGFQGSGTHPDRESRSTCSISSQWKQHKHSQRLSWYINEPLFGQDKAENSELLW